MSPDPLHAVLAERIDVIAIGASAGGVEALGMLLPALPAQMRQAVLVVLHLPRNRESALASLLAAQSAVPVTEAEDKQPLPRGAVAIAPPDYHLLAERGGHLALSVDAPVHWSRPSIDVLFESAADAFGDRLLALLLTGANDDGAEGFARVHACGGATLVQRPQEALAPEMPRAALARVPDAHVRSLAEIAALFRGLPRSRDHR